MSEPLFSVFVPGKAQPAGSKRGFVRGNRAVIVDANPNAASWKERVAYFAREAWRAPLLDEPLVVSFVFTMQRPSSHFGTRRGERYLKPSAPYWHTGAPDALKMARAIEDALQGVLYRNDSLIAQEHLRKVYGEQAGCAIVVRRAIEPAAALRSA